MSVTQGIVQKLTAELTHTVHIDTMRFGHTKILSKEPVQLLVREFPRLPFEPSRIHDTAPGWKPKGVPTCSKGI